MGAPRNRAGNKSGDADKHAEFMRYCDSIVERALEATDIIMKNRPGKPSRGR
jgi:hypothetical protein